MIVRQLLERRVAGAPREALPDQPVPPPTAVGPVRVLLSFTSLDVHPLPLQVLDLVHPSLYPLVYGLSRRVTTTDTEAPAAAAQAAAPLADGPPSSALQPVQEVPANGQAHGIVEGSPACACAGSDGTGSGGTGSDPLAPNGGAATASGIGAGTGFNTGTSGGTRTADAAGEAAADAPAAGMSAEELAADSGNRDLIAATIANAESWHTSRFGSWMSEMGSGDVVDEDAAPRASEYTSDRFQWLPAEVFIGADGRAMFDSYVNNMHPARHAALYAATARLLQRMVPLFERTLAASAVPSHRALLVPDDNNNWWSPATPREFWKALEESGEAATLLRRWRAEAAGEAANEHPHAAPVSAARAHDAAAGTGDGAANAAADKMDADERGTDDVGAPVDAMDAQDERTHGPAEGVGGSGTSRATQDDDALDAEINFRKWYKIGEHYREQRQWVGPTMPDEFEPPSPPPAVNLRSRNLQVIVKYAEIVLTPERPEYGGGVWHVEGMENEAIVASCIAYLSADNITESRLHFRSMVADPDYEQNDDEGIEKMYGMVNNGPANEVLGAALCVPGRMLCWHNALQHRVAPFRLANASRPGRRTIAAVFLVHPETRVLSTRDVPPQQMAWHDAESRLGRLMPEEVKRKLDTLREFPISLERAKELREELMDERRLVVQATNEEVFEREFSLCEH